MCALPVKIIPEMTYYMFSKKLKLYSLTHCLSVMHVLWLNGTPYQKL